MLTRDGAGCRGEPINISAIRVPVQKPTRRQDTLGGLDSRLHIDTAPARWRERTHLRHGGGRHGMSHGLLEIGSVHIGHADGVHALDGAHVVGHGHRVHRCRHIDRVGVHGGHRVHRCHRR